MPFYFEPFKIESVYLGVWFLAADRPKYVEPEAWFLFFFSAEISALVLLEYLKLFFTEDIQKGVGTTYFCSLAFVCSRSTR